MQKVESLFQENAQDVINTHTAERQKKDKRLIRDVRHLVASTKTGKALLEWGDENNIMIVVDRQTEAGGYYVTGHKTVALNGTSGKNYLAGTLAHELRHAWQDAQGLIPCISDVGTGQQSVEDYITRVKFIEADAFAIGDAVRREVEKKRRKEIREQFLLESGSRWKEVTNDNEERDWEKPENLAELFTAFFRNLRKRDFYEARCLARYAQHAGLEKIVVPCGSGEYLDVSLPSQEIRGVDVNDAGDVRKLGALFDGQNYMDHLETDFHLKPKYRKLFLEGAADFFAPVAGTPSLESNKMLFRYVQKMRP